MNSFLEVSGRILPLSIKCSEIQFVTGAAGSGRGAFLLNSRVIRSSGIASAIKSSPSSCAPHSSQNIAPVTFLYRHFGQTIIRSTPFHSGGWFHPPHILLRDLLHIKTRLVWPVFFCNH